MITGGRRRGQTSLGDMSDSGLVRALANVLLSHLCQCRYLVHSTVLTRSAGALHKTLALRASIPAGPRLEWPLDAEGVAWRHGKETLRGPRVRTRSSTSQTRRSNPFPAKFQPEPPLPSSAQGRRDFLLFLAQDTDLLSPSGTPSLSGETRRS